LACTPAGFAVKSAAATHLEEHAMEPAVARLAWAQARVAHCVHPPWEAGEFESISEPASVGVAFCAQQDAVVRPAGHSATQVRHVPAASVGLCGPEPLHWVRTPAASDTVEITATPALRQQIAEEMGVGSHADLDDQHGWHDPVVMAVALQFRAACRGWIHLSDVARDELVHALYAHVHRSRFGARGLPRKPRALDAARLHRVTDWIMAHLGGPIALADLSRAAGLSTFHFARSFKAATGLPPHRFVAALRLKEAEDRLRHSRDPVERIAHDLGFENLSHFRRAFRAQAGCAPSALRLP
jgi:AraC family transcriptional regulator